MCTCIIIYIICGREEKGEGIGKGREGDEEGKRVSREREERVDVYMYIQGEEEVEGYRERDEEEMRARGGRKWKERREMEVKKGGLGG